MQCSVQQHSGNLGGTRRGASLLDECTFGRRTTGVSHIHFIGGEKGGVGKSVVSRLLSQYLLDHELPYAGADADTSHRTLARSYGSYTQGVELEAFSSADEIMNRALAGERRVIVDLPAQSLRHLQRWFESADIIHFGKSMEIGITLWHVTDGGFDSVADLERTLQMFHDHVAYVVVRNLGRSRDFSQLGESEALRKLEALGGKIIDLPELEPSTMYKIDRFGSSFWAAVNNESGDWAMTPMERQRVRAWLERAYRAVETLGAAF